MQYSNAYESGTCSVECSENAQTRRGHRVLKPKKKYQDHIIRLEVSLFCIKWFLNSFLWYKRTCESLAQCVVFYDCVLQWKRTNASRALSVQTWHKHQCRIIIWQEMSWLVHNFVSTKPQDKPLREDTIFSSQLSEITLVRVVVVNTWWVRSVCLSYNVPPS